MNPEDKARQEIDDLLKAAEWAVQSRDEVNLTPARGVAIRGINGNIAHGDNTASCQSIMSSEQ